jgi:uncharacterized protein YkwD/uncharacterized protein YraI
MGLMRSPLRYQAVAAFAALLLLAPGAAAAPVEPVRLYDVAYEVTSADACLDEEEVAFLGLINDHRAMSGLPPLSVSASLSSAAAYHSIDMAANGYLDHALLDGTSVPQNMANFGYDGSTHGENIAAGMASAGEAMQIWQGSAGHNANMLGGQFGAIGIGRAYDAASPHGWYWTTIFGDVSDGPGWLCGEAAPLSKSVSLFQSVDGATATSDVSLRSGPAETYELVTTLPPSTTMTVTGREQQSYVPVKVDGLFGWVSADWIERGSVSLEQTAASPDAASQPGTATAISDVEMRSAPGDDAAMMTTIPSVSVVTLTGEAQDGFLGVVFNGQEGWANASFLAVAEVAPGTTTLLQPADAAAQTQPVDAAVASAPAQPFQTSPGTQTVTTTNVNLRSQPSAESMVLSVLPEGTAVTMTGSQANGYVNVRIDGQAGWIDSAYLQ